MAPVQFMTNRLRYVSIQSHSNVGLAATFDTARAHLCRQLALQGRDSILGQSAAERIAERLRRNKRRGVEQAVRGTWYIGMDLSVRSSGIACRFVPNDAGQQSIGTQLHLLYFPKTEEQKSCPFLSVGCQTVNVAPKESIDLWYHRLEMYESKHLSREEQTKRHRSIAKQIVNRIKLIVGVACPCEIFIEEYTYHNPNSSSNHALAECTGIVKSLLDENQYAFHLVNNSAPKMAFARHGKATKHMMWEAVQKLHPFFTRFIERHFSYSYVAQMRTYSASFQVQMEQWRQQCGATQTDELDDDEFEWAGQLVGALPKPKFKLPDIPSPHNDLIDCWALSFHDLAGARAKSVTRTKSKRRRRAQKTTKAKRVRLV